MLLIVLLLALNGIFAMAEIAIVTSKKYRLEKLANEGNINARIALQLSSNSTTFLSTIQVGITFVGILAGALGETSVTRQLESWLIVAGFSSFAEIIARLIVVAGTGYMFIVFGELIPKRLALHAPERIAVIIAPLMQLVAFAASPVVSVLSGSTDIMMHALQLKTPQEDTVSEEEVKMLIKEGARVGVFEISEKDIVERTLHLGDKHVSQLMTPRNEIITLRADMPVKEMLGIIIEHPHSYFPVVQKNIDSCIGVVRTKTLLANFLTNKEKALKNALQKQLVIPEHMFALKALEMFKKSQMHMSLIVDEYGSIQGLISLTDILEAIVGDIPSDTESGERDFIERDDGSWLVNGLVTIDEFKDFFKVGKMRDTKTGDVHTIGGFVVSHLGRVPLSGDNFMYDELKFEVIDMDGNRVDKVLVSGVNPAKSKKKSRKKSTS